MVYAFLFVDWLSIYQVHRPGSLPLLGSEFRVHTSLETGEIVAERVTTFQLEGSFETSLRVRCDGTTVSVEGNPSAFDRPDNLFGFRSLQAAVEVYNRVLVILGLPPFDNLRPHEEMPLGSRVRFYPVAAGRPGIVGRFASDNGRQSAHLDSLLADGRPRITRVDVTENLFTSDAAAFIRQMSGYVHQGKAGYLYPDGNTVDWSGFHGNRKGSRRVHNKYYNKGAEIDRKIKYFDRKTFREHDIEKVEERRDYLVKLRNFCIQNGMVRRETSFKSTQLIKLGLQYLDNWSESVMAEIVYPYQFHRKIKMEETRLEGIMDALVSKGIAPRVARQAELIHTAWVNGQDISKLCGSSATKYRYRNLLLSFGVDINTSCDISRITLRVNRCSFKEAVPPSWYQLPDESKPLNKAA